MVGFRKLPDPESEANEINKQAGFGCALVYLGYSNPIFQSKAKKMAEFFLGEHWLLQYDPAELLCLPYQHEIVIKT